MFGFKSEGEKMEAPVDGVMGDGSAPERPYAVNKRGEVTMGEVGENERDVLARAVADNQEEGSTVDADAVASVQAEQGSIAEITEDDVLEVAAEEGIKLEKVDVTMSKTLAEEDVKAGESDRKQAIINAIKRRVDAKQNVKVDGFDYTVDKNLGVERQEEK